MMKRDFRALVLVVVALCSAAERGRPGVDKRPNSEGVAGSEPLARVERNADSEDDLRPVSFTPGEFYFRFGGRQTFLLGRNPTGWEVGHFAPLLQWARASGEKMVRLHLTLGMPPSGPAGNADEDWTSRWERVFDRASENGLYVLPVFAVWADWNDGSK